MQRSIFLVWDSRIAAQMLVLLFVWDQTFISIDVTQVLIHLIAIIIMTAYGTITLLLIMEVRGKFIETEI